jgi:hypothetical protein
LAKGSTTIENPAVAAAFEATLAGRFALRDRHAPPAITMSSAAEVALERSRTRSLNTFRGIASSSTLV